jgi:flagellar protein FliO/FliZ
MPGTGAAGASYGDLLVTSLLVLGGVCVAAFVVVRLAGRLLAPGRARGSHLMDVVARLPLEPRRSLFVVEVAGKALLVGTSEMGLSLLSELDVSEVRARVVERPSFGDLVRAAWLRRRGPPVTELGDADGRSVAAQEEPASDAPGLATHRSASSDVPGPNRGGGPDAGRTEEAR